MWCRGVERGASDRRRRHWRPNAGARTQMDIMARRRRARQQNIRQSIIYFHTIRERGAARNRTAGMTPARALPAHPTRLMPLPAAYARAAAAASALADAAASNTTAPVRQFTHPIW